MWTMLAGVPGKLKTILDRLTAARAGYLDRLDATISSRAAAATALSNAVWTAAHAERIGLLAPGQQEFLTSGTWTRPAGVTRVRVIVVGGGASGAASWNANGTAIAGGGEGGNVVDRIVPVSGNVAVTVGAGGAGHTAGPGNPGNNSSFGSVVAAGGRIFSATPGVGKDGPGSSGGAIGGGGGGGGGETTYGGSCAGYGRGGSGAATGDGYAGGGGGSYLNGSNGVVGPSSTPPPANGGGGSGGSVNTTSSVGVQPGANGRVIVMWGGGI